MAQQIINVGTTANDGTGDLLRNGFIKVNQNFTELYTNRISGSGTDNYIPRFNGTNALENSIIFDNGTNVGIGTTSPGSKLDVSSGNINLSNSFNLTSRNNANTFNIALIGRSSTDRVIIDADGYGTNIGGGGTVLINPSGGNVGIGTATPSTKLHTFLADGVNDNILRIQNGSNAYASLINLVANNDGGAIYNSITSNTNGGTEHFKIWGGASTSTMAISTGGSEKMRITSGGNVGIGTTNPTEKLHVAGVAQILDDGSRGRITFQISSAQNDLFSTTTGFGAYRNLKLSSNELILSSGGTTERMRITSGGNVGIGTTSPASALHVSSSGEVSRLQSSTTTLYNTYIANGVNVGYIGNGTGVVGGGSATDFGIQATNNFVFATTAGTERMRITSGGNVGIGTSSPTAAKFVLNSGTTNQNALINGDKIGFTRTSDSAEVVYFKKDTSLGAEGTANINGYDGIQFRTQGAESVKAIITSGGELCVGTTTAVGAGLVNIKGAANTFNLLAIQNTFSGGGNFAVFLNPSGGQTGAITMLTTTSTLYATTSDYRLKQDFKNFNGLELLSKIKVYDYEWKSNKSRMNGVIAHELQEVVPYAVTGEKDGEQMQQVDYSKLVPILVQAIQEQQKQIKELQTLVN